MRKLIIILLCFAIITGCKKTGVQSPVSIIGKWSHLKLETRLIEDKAPNFPLMDTVITYVPGNYTQFNSDGTGIESHFYSGVSSTNNFQYTISGTILNFTDFSISPGGTITQLDEHNLIIHNEYLYGVYTAIKYKVDDYYTR